MQFIFLTFISATNVLVIKANKTLLVLNPFYAIGLFLYSLKTSKNLWFSDVFRGYRKISVTRNGLIGGIILANADI